MAVSGKSPARTVTTGCVVRSTVSHSPSMLLMFGALAGVLETASALAPSPNDEYGCAHALYLDLGDLNSVEAFASE